MRNRATGKVEQIVAAGGFDVFLRINTVEIYDISGNTWQAGERGERYITFRVRQKGLFLVVMITFDNMLTHGMKVAAWESTNELLVNQIVNIQTTTINQPF